MSGERQVRLLRLPRRDASTEPHRAVFLPDLQAVAPCVPTRAPWPARRAGDLSSRAGMSRRSGASRAPGLAAGPGLARAGGEVGSPNYGSNKRYQAVQRHGSAGAVAPVGALELEAVGSGGLRRPNPPAPVSNMLPTLGRFPAFCAVLECRHRAGRSLSDVRKAQGIAAVCGCSSHGFQNRCLRPLGHSSTCSARFTCDLGGLSSPPCPVPSAGRSLAPLGRRGRRLRARCDAARDLDAAAEAATLGSPRLA
jgi:hypothetical protein